jgi:hypothetical protein
MTQTLPAFGPLVVAAVDLGVGALFYRHVATSVGVLLAGIGVLLVLGLAYEASTRDGAMPDSTPDHR